MHTELLIFGAGGHAKVVLEALRGINKYCKIRLVDQDPNKKYLKLLGDISTEYFNDWEDYPKYCHIAIGDNKTRYKLCKIAEQNNKKLSSIIHNDANVSPSSIINVGAFVAAQALISAETDIGKYTIINHGAVVDHDCKVGSYSHVAPNSTLCGGVSIGMGCLIGAGSTILPNVQIGSNVIVGAGSVVKENIEDNQIIIT
jgi:sugar O-acyltransferase (sialic acid O-acetyltransferase NeuD family)